MANGGSGLPVLDLEKQLVTCWSDLTVFKMVTSVISYW
jgi:hypothetical protein